ncbi:zinc finger protein 160-like isoform X2 [Denticeps clupeoides]|uniref:zinc finger protein 160-like isoform X2 n=1 Tax=Denticeps clupeoides TaxID=299321 RepID=UPI0010A42974|nr:zinc finger protein 160-like isoform X2 [Denticeps clupeoides]
MQTRRLPGEGLPLSTLRFLTSPLRLLSSAVWKIVQQRDVLNYGMLEEFVTSVTESVPELLSYRQRAQLVLGLRAKLILELCRSENSPDHAAIQPHLERIRIPAALLAQTLIRDVDVETSESNFLALVEILLNDPVERNIFFQEVFPVEYGAKFDSALQKLIWTFVTRLEEVLPVPTLEMTASMLTSAPAVMEECLEVLSHPQDLQDLLYHHKHLENVNFSCASPLPSSDHDCIFSCLSHPPLVRVVIGTEHRASDIELVSSFCEEVQAEPDVSMSTEKEEATVNKGENDVDVVEEGVGEGGSDVDVVEEGVGEGGSDVDVVEEGVGEGGNDVDVVEERVGEGGNDVDVVEERVGEGESLKQVEAEQQMETVRKAAETVASEEPVMAELEKDEPLRAGVVNREEASPADKGLTFKEDEIIVPTDKKMMDDKQEEGGAQLDLVENELMKDPQPSEQRDETVERHADTRSSPQDHADEEDLLQISTTSNISQPAVKLEKLDITGRPLPRSQLRKSTRARTRKLKLLWRKNRGPEIAWLEPEEQKKTSPKNVFSVVIPSTRGWGEMPPPVAFACSQCSFSDGQEQNLHNHLMQNHPEEHQRLLVAGVHGAEGPESPRPKACHRGPFRRCGGCGKRFQHLFDAKRHEQGCGVIQAPTNLNGERPEPQEHQPLKEDADDQEDFQDGKTCSLCGLCLTRASDMARHMRSHSVERPYECAQCDKTYRYPYNLKKHMDFCHGLADSEDPDPPSASDSPPEARANAEAERGWPAEALFSKVCPTCGKTFTRATDMRRHQKCHLSRRFACPKCSESFRYPFDLKQHQRDVCGESGGERSVEARSLKMHFTCDRCGKKFNQFTKLERHKLLHDQPRKPPKRLHKCAKCAEMFRTLYELGKHQRCHWGDDPLRCTQCGRRFSSTSHLTGHKQVHLLVCTLKCTMCEETCTELPSLRQHYAAAHQVKRAYPCSHCEKSFTELCSLVRHLRVHTGERPYRCSQCPKSFISPSKLLLHEKAHAGTAKRERQHLCHECGKCFYTSAELTRHEVCHREDRPHTCAHCGKSFKRLRSLTSHMESHSDERVGHPCSYCGKLFSKPGALVRHNRIHTGERPHACGECHKRFLTHSEVQKHMRYHTGERPFKCAHCRKSFTQSCYLTAHMRTHTGERPYACGFCERRFADNAHMKRHLLIHTGEKPYVCEQCGKAFNRKNLLNLHLKAHLSK